MKIGGYVLIIFGTLMSLLYFAPPMAVSTRIAGTHFEFVAISDVGLGVGVLSVISGIVLMIRDERNSSSEE